MERIETVIVGGGQAGLATSYFLTQHGREHVVLEQTTRPAPVWSEQRWDSFTLVTPNWTVRMPGAEYDGPDREGFMPRDEVVAYFERYVDRFRLPIRYNARVRAIEPMDGGGFRVITAEQTFAARNVVVATGFEQSPSIPPFAAAVSPEASARGQPLVCWGLEPSTPSMSCLLIKASNEEATSRSRRWRRPCPLLERPQP